jgi:hypothetical protein
MDQTKVWPLNADEKQSIKRGNAMGLLKKYYFYKRALQVLLFVNVLLIAVGGVAGYRYFETHQPQAAEMALIGLATLCFGIFLPLYFSIRLTKQIKHIRLQTERMMAQWISMWLDTYKNYHGDAYREPQFWLNVVLFSFETVSGHVDHPVLHVLAEFAPLLRQEMSRSLDTHKKPRARKAA